MNQVSPSKVQENELNLIDVVNFLADSWKKLAIAGLVGAVLGLSVWLFFVSYKAEYVLLNSNNGIDLVSWKSLQKSLPNLASQIEDEDKVPVGQSEIYKDLANEQWWSKNVIPSYAISKADAKDLAGISKDLDLASTTILSLTLRSDGSSKASSIKNVKVAAKFLRTGSAYLQLRNILNGYETETIATVADLQKKITATEIEMGFQVQRAKNLEDLLKRFPGSTIGTNQVVDPKDSGAKYLPLATQVIAVNSDINLTKENLQRLRDQLAQIALMKTILDQAIPLAEKTFDGLLLSEQLLGLEVATREKIAKEDIKQQELLDRLRSQFLQVQVRFTKGLESNTAPISGKKGVIKFTAGGMAAAFVFMLLALLGRQVWANAKIGTNK